MAETLFAVVNADGLVENVIVADQEFVDALPDAITDPNVDTGTLSGDHRFVDVTSKDPRPGVGWTRSGNGRFVAPVPPPVATISAAPTSIPADGTTTSTVTYTALPDETGDVEFDVNGHKQTETIASGRASVQVASRTAGDTITVTCRGLTATVTVNP